MKSVKLPDKMIEGIRDYIIAKKGFGYESIAEFVRSAVRNQMLAPKPDVHIGMLVACAYMRNVAGLQHRTIHEFSQFIEDVMSGKEELKKYQFDWNDHNAIRIWIEKFADYCKNEYKEDAHDTIASV